MWDEAIGLTQELIAAKEERKKGLMQKIFSQELRFVNEDGKAFPAWEKRKLHELLYQHKQRNYNLQFGKQDVLSVSGTEGIVNQVEHLGRSYAGKSVANYHIVHHNDIVYTKSPLKANPFGIIKSNKGNSGIVSTLYAVYTCTELAESNYLDHYFSLDDNVNKYLRPLVHKGAKNDMKINNQHVLSGSITCPTKPEQHKIAEFLSICDCEIALLKQKLAALQKQKKGLMQRLLTGQVRVRLDDGLESKTPLPELTMLENFSIRSADWYYEKNGKYPSRIAIQKIPYLFKAFTDKPLELEHEWLAAEDGRLELEHERHLMGPYSKQLHQLLESMNNVYIVGYGDGSQAAEIQPTAEAIRTANVFFHDHPDLEAAFTRFTECVAGFENAFWLELLATVHWLLEENPQATENEIIVGVRCWSDRKANLYSPKAIYKAFDHLRQFSKG